MALLAAALVDGRLERPTEPDVRRTGRRRLVVSAGNDPDGNGGPGITFLVSIDGNLLARVDGSHADLVARRQPVRGLRLPGRARSSRDDSPDPDKGRGTVYLVARDGATVRVKDAYAPAWSPDGSSIAVLTGDPVAAGVAVLAADGTGRHAIPKVSFNGAGSLRWLP